MKLITSPVPWGCSAAALAMVIGKDYDFIIEEIGHDGSEIINRDLMPPGCYKGFHMQELIEVAFGSGYAMTPIEVLPVQTATGDDEYDVEFAHYRNPGRRLRYHLSQGKGILVGKLNKYWHAVAWDGTEIFDPRGQIYSFDDCKINVATFWRFTFLF